MPLINDTLTVGFRSKECTKVINMKIGAKEISRKLRERVAIEEDSRLFPRNNMVAHNHL